MRWKDWTARLRVALGTLHGSRAFGGPYQASLYLTNRCNIRCIHCFYYSPLLQHPNLMKVRGARQLSLRLPDDQEIRHLQSLEVDAPRTNALIDELVSMGTRRIDFTGRGEPFLHKNVLEFMGRVKAAGCLSSVNTAGHMLNRSIIDALLEMRYDNMRITTMGGTGEMYLRTHPGSKATAFPEIEENLIYMAERKAALGLRKPRINLHCVVISQNCDGLRDFAEFAARVGADRAIYHPVDDVGDPDLSHLTLKAEEASHVRRELVEVGALLDSKGVEHNVGGFLKAFGGRLDTRALYRAIPCYYGWINTLIDVEGMVYSCCRCYSPLGNVFESSFREIWHGEVYRRMRREAKTLNRRGRPVGNCHCGSCSHYAANLRAYQLLHPIRSRSARLRELHPQCPEEERY